MSFTDDKSADLEERLETAWQKCLYGKAYSPAYEMARRIKWIRKILADKEEKNADPTLNQVESKLLLQTAGLLLIASLTESRKLRDIAKALDAKKNTGGIQANVLRAYERCINGEYQPTVIERGDCFVRCALPTVAQLLDVMAQRREGPGTSRQGLERILKSFGLPVSKGKRGRPRGSKSIIRNVKR